MDSKDFVLPSDVESAMRIMLLQLLAPLIDHPEQCSIDIVGLAGSTMFVVCVAPDDLEKFIGQNMRTGKSLQIIVGAVGAKSQRRFSLTFQVDTGTGKSNTNLLPEITHT